MSEDHWNRSNLASEAAVEICCPARAAEIVGEILQKARHEQVGVLFQIDFDDKSELEIEIGDKLFRFTITDATDDYPDRSSEGGEA